MRDAIIPMPGNEVTARALERLLDMEVLNATVSHLPDGESYVRMVVPSTVARPSSYALSIGPMTNWSLWCFFRTP